MENKKNEFGPLRSKFWPIHSYELKKFIPLTLIFFFISLNYSMLRNLKDIFVLDGAVTESMYFIKILGVMPFVILYTIVYNKLSGKYGRHKMFYYTISYFLVFFAIFAFVLYPNKDSLNLDGVYETGMHYLPSLKGLWASLKIWHISLFYINSELWGTFGISVVLWTFINEITNVSQSKRFYSFLALGANVALIFSATFLRLVGKNMVLLVYLVMISGIVTLLIYKNFYNNIKKFPEMYGIDETKTKKSKVKLGMWESFKFLMKSKYLGLISILVFAYGFVMSLIEAVWKSQVKLLQSSSGGDITVLSRIYSNEVYLIGITSIIMILFASSWIMAKSWRLSALLTPVVASILGALFFAFMMFGKNIAFFENIFGVSSLTLAVFAGMLQVVFIKSFKYTLFDPTKESVYIPLDYEEKVRGKAAVDGIGGRLGKSGGAALISFVLVPLLGPISEIVPYLFVVIALALFIWIKAVYALDIEFKKKLSQERENI
jgi:AAA family ATP:ADP antiporter